MSSAMSRLQQYLKLNELDTSISPLTPDASNREYFRIGWDGKTAIACVYPAPFAAKELSYLDVTELFSKCDLPVAGVYDVDGSFGIVVQEDLGDRIMREALEVADDAERNRLFDAAIDLIARIQSATARAFDMDSVASRLRFDEDKLSWELSFFKTHYFGSLRNEKLPADEEDGLDAEFRTLSKELESRALVLTHRDFHAANIMIDSSGSLRIIDHQDARIGSVAYDLVSLLLDRVTEKPDHDWLEAKKRRFLHAREKIGLDPLDTNAFAHEFDLVSVQRCLKAIGTFSNQSANLDRTGYTRFINPMFLVVLEACERLERFPVLQNAIRARLEP